MGPDEDSTLPAEDREPGQPPAWRPRTRCCLLKGCERRFCPQRARQRYCSDECRQETAGKGRPPCFDSMKVRILLRHTLLVGWSPPDRTLADPRYATATLLLPSSGQARVCAIRFAVAA